jgi:hypothetical protein
MDSLGTMSARAKSEKLPIFAGFTSTLAHRESAAAAALIVVVVGRVGVGFLMAVEIGSVGTDAVVIDVGTASTRAPVSLLHPA